jgi:uncharacterized protein YkwD
MMTIDSTNGRPWRRRLLLAASAALAAGGALLPVPAAAQGTCPTTSTGATATSTISAADRDEILRLHNEYRAEVGTPALTWDGSLADSAQGWADVTAPLGHLCHDPGANNQGENLADNQSAVAGVQSWYGEKSKYVANPGPVNSRTNNWWAWGHYSQMVWRTTERIGCGAAPSTQFSGNVVLACRYSPPGNFEGQTPY